METLMSLDAHRTPLAGSVIIIIKFSAKVNYLGHLTVSIHVSIHLSDLENYTSDSDKLGHLRLHPLSTATPRSTKSISTQFLFILVNLKVMDLILNLAILQKHPLDHPSKHLGCKGCLNAYHAIAPSPMRC